MHCTELSAAGVAPRIVVEVFAVFLCRNYIVFCIPHVAPRIVLEVAYVFEYCRYIAFCISFQWFLRVLHSDVAPHIALDVSCLGMS